VLIGLLIVGGCQSHPADFMTRVQQDCIGGDKWSCDFLNAMTRPLPVRDASIRVETLVPIAGPETDDRSDHKHSEPAEDPSVPDSHQH